MSYVKDLGQQLGSQAGSGILGIGLGMLTADWNDRRQYNMAKKLGDLQLGYDKSMTDYAHQKQLEMWNATNYQAQMEHLKKAGLNPGLIYGMGGGGGATVGTGAATSTGAAHAPVGGGEIMGMAQMAMQRELLQAQKENIQANTEKTLAEKNKLSGVDTQESQSRIALNNVNKQIQDLELKLKDQTFQEQVNTITIEMRKASNELDALVRTNDINDKTYFDTIKRIQGEAIQIGLENILIQANTNLSNRQAWKIGQEVAQGWQKLSIEAQQLVINKLQLGVNQQNADTGQYSAETQHEALQFEKSIKDITEGEKEVLRLTGSLLQAVAFKSALKQIPQKVKNVFKNKKP